MAEVCAAMSLTDEKKNWEVGVGVKHSRYTDSTLEPVAYVKVEYKEYEATSLARAYQKYIDTLGDSSESKDPIAAATAATAGLAKAQPAEEDIPI